MLTTLLTAVLALVLPQAATRTTAADVTVRQISYTQLDGATNAATLVMLRLR